MANLPRPHSLSKRGETGQTGGIDTLTKAHGRLGVRQTRSALLTDSFVRLEHSNEHPQRNTPRL